MTLWRPSLHFDGGAFEGDALSWFGSVARCDLCQVSAGPFRSHAGARLWCEEHSEVEHYSNLPVLHESQRIPADDPRTVTSRKAKAERLAAEGRLCTEPGCWRTAMRPGGICRAHHDGGTP